MSKAFDTIQRGTLFEDLKEILEPDELHLIHLLLDNVKIAVKLENIIGTIFESRIGSPQGDAASALFFIIYLAVTLKIAKNKLNEKNQLYPSQLCDHSYEKFERLLFLLDQQYADDISWASTDTSVLKNIEEIVPRILESRNLHVNTSKTEKYSISRNSPSDSWKSCKLVGSKLDTESDITNRKVLANLAFNTLKPIFKEKKCSQNVKLAIFSALIESIFLYNSEIWTLTKKLENEIDVFQRKLLRYLMGFKYTEDKKQWPSNDELYNRTKQTPWSVKISKRRLSFFGHICRLSDQTPAKIALKEATRKVKRPQGKPRTTYIQVIRNQLKTKNINSIEDAIKIAQNRQIWRVIALD